jgi:acyl carrier protein
MPPATTVDQVIAIVTHVLGIEGRAASMDASTELFGSLPELDSLAVVELVQTLEDSFDFEIDDSEFSGEIFETVGSLAEFLDGKRAAV